MRNLLDMLHDADAIEIDGTFCRHFHLELEKREKDDVEIDGTFCRHFHLELEKREKDDVVYNIEFECGGYIHEHYFTKKQLEEAVHITGTHGFVVNNSVDGTHVIPYSLKEIIA